MVNSFLSLASRLRPRHARVVLLAITVVLSDLLFRLPFLSSGQRLNPKPLNWEKGLSIIIPHQRGAEMLDKCMARLVVAMQFVEEPVEVIVVINGSPMVEYALVQARYPEVRWLFFPKPLGFTSAVLKGITHVRHGAIYLLNDDMLLEPQALITVLSWRAPRTFAVASQIFLQDIARRREETGWTSMTMENAMPVPRHELPVGSTIHGTVWAGAGSALFHAGLLRVLMPGCLPFDPFYWEDVDLGVRAWRLGYGSVLCTDSIAWHKHRATVEKFYLADEVTRIFERNRLLFQLRNPFPRQSLKKTLQHIVRVDRKTARELGSWRSCIDLWRMRWRAFHAPHRNLDYSSMWTKIYARSQRPVLMFVSPFAVLPPAHGGAVRTHRLASALARDFDVTLVSDERNLYDAPNENGYAPFSSVYLVGGRPAEPVGLDTNRIARIQSHSHQALKDELCRVVDLYQPAIVVVEHMELGGMIDTVTKHRPKFILSLQDVLLSPTDPSQADADRFESALIDRFDGLVVCSAEDQALLGNRVSRIVPNGFDLDLSQSYVPSRGKRAILFMGPFRAPNNWQGILDFVGTAYPEIEAAVSGVSLTILGGKGARQMAASHPCFDNPMIEILEYVEDVLPLLHACALTINPQAELRGSSIKVIESVAVGRVCVSTRAGARGWLDAGFGSLVVVERTRDFATPIIQLLIDDEARIAQEIQEQGKLATCSWDAAGNELRDYLQKIVGVTR